MTEVSSINTMKDPNINQFQGIAFDMIVKNKIEEVDCSFMVLVLKSISDHLFCDNPQKGVLIFRTIRNDFTVNEFAARVEVSPNKFRFFLLGTGDLRHCLRGLGYL